MKLNIKKATTDVTVYLFIQDSTVTTGAGKTGLVYNSASLVAYYVRPLGSAAAITLATQTVTGAHSDGGFVEVDAANMPGVYRLDLPDAVCATGVDSVVAMLKGATAMAPLILELQLVDNTAKDVYDRVGAAGAGLTAVPWNASWDAEVNAEVVDALNVDTYAEPGQEAPGATVSLAKKISYLYKGFRNRIEQNATQSILYADDATTVDQVATVSDDGTTFARGEFGSGP